VYQHKDEDMEQIEPDSKDEAEYKEDDGGDYKDDEYKAEDEGDKDDYKYEDVEDQADDFTPEPEPQVRRSSRLRIKSNSQNQGPNEKVGLDAGNKPRRSIRVKLKKKQDHEETKNKFPLNNIPYGLRSRIPKSQVKEDQVEANGYSPPHQDDTDAQDVQRSSRYLLRPRNTQPQKKTHPEEFELDNSPSNSANATEVELAPGVTVRRSGRKRKLPPRFEALEPPQKKQKLQITLRPRTKGPNTRSTVINDNKVDSAKEETPLEIEQPVTQVQVPKAKKRLRKRKQQEPNDDDFQPESEPELSSDHSLPATPPRSLKRKKEEDEDFEEEETKLRRSKRLKRHYKE